MLVITFSFFVVRGNAGEERGEVPHGELTGSVVGKGGEFGVGVSKADFLIHFRI